MSIEIIIESALDFGPGFLASHLADAWRDAGHAVRIRSIGERPGRPDIAFLHVDRSVIPRSLVEPLGYDCPVMNGAVLDITKRRISRQLVASDDGYDGQVIVKTNENCMGLPERWRAARAEGVRGRLNRILQRVGRSSARAFPLGEYPVYPTPRAVPWWVWRSRRYVVERFTPERDGSFFVLRNWLFLGDRELGIISWSRVPIVKASNIERHVLGGEVPDELRALRRELGFDYGKFDWVLADGRPVLLDANRTPTAQKRTSRLQAAAADLARGIECFLPRR